MKKLLLILCLSAASINAMDDGEKVLNDLKTQVMPELETALQKWQIAIEQHPISTIKDLESAQQAVSDINDLRNTAQNIYQGAQSWLAPMNLLTLQPDSDNPHNKSVLALCSTFNKFRPQVEAHEKKFQEYNKLINDYAYQQNKLEALDVLGKTQEKYAKTANALQAHLAGQKTKETFFAEHQDDDSMINSIDEFNMYTNYFTPDTHKVRNDIDPYAFRKDSGALQLNRFNEWMAKQEKLPLDEWVKSRAKVRRQKDKRLKIRMPNECPRNERTKSEGNLF